MKSTTALALSLAFLYHGVSVACFGQSLHSPDGILLDVARLEYAESGWNRLTEDGSRIPVSVIRWGSWQGIQEEQAVWLSDGSWLCGDLEFRDMDVVVHSDWFDPVEIPMSSLRGIIVNPRSSLRDWVALNAWMHSAKGTEDQVLLTSDEAVAGILSIEPASPQSPEQFQIRSSSQAELQWTSDEIQAVVFSPALSGRLPAELAGQALGISDGALLQTDSLKVVENRLRVMTHSGLKLTSIDSVQRFSKQLRYVYAKSDSKFLSDLSVAQYKSLQNGNSLKWELGVNQDCLHRPLEVEGGLVEKGVGMHASSQAAYRWDGTAAVFRAECRFANLELGANPKLGNARCKLLLAREGKLETVAEIVLDRERNSVAVIEADVTGARLVVLVTEENEWGQLGDHVLWLDARLDPMSSREPKK